jgi:hypothetical protein
MKITGKERAVSKHSIWLIPSMASEKLDPITGSQDRLTDREPAFEGSSVAIAIPSVMSAEKRENRRAASVDRNAKLAAPVSKGIKMRNTEIIGLL